VHVFRITEATQPYAWGSSFTLQDLFGRPEANLAEAWLGTHCSAPSVLSDGTGRSLVEVVAEHPESVLGADVVARFGPQLPYLLKVLAAEHPLSLQVHPHIDRAREGYDEEDAAGVPLDAPHRNYRDRNHKPELVFALTQFEALCGFRAPRRAAELFAGLDAPLAQQLHRLLVERPTSDGIRAAFTHLLDPATRPGPDAVALLQDEYPGDPGVVTSLLLNPVTLQPGDAMFVPAGGVHAYLHGVAVEIMASSDNVLRAGLTPKHVDVPELLRNVDYVAAPPIRVAPEVFHGATKVFYAPVDDFELSVTDLDDTGEHPLPGRGPRILLCLEGEVHIATSDDGTLTLGRGQAAFVPAADGRLSVRGTGRLVQADVP
jgi:mannose-6-phosphate isomerase